MSNTFIEWFGYIASFIILISLVSSSILKLRWINLIGAILFAIYGGFLGSIPVIAMNIGIALIDIYYIIKIYSIKQHFQLLEIKPDSNYFSHYIDFFKSDILKTFHKSDYVLTNDIIGFYILKNMVTAGIFLASIRDNNSLNIELDYVTIEYRDFKIGKFIFETSKTFFIDKGYTNLYAVSNTTAHSNYLLKMGFEKQANSNEYLKTLI